MEEAIHVRRQEIQRKYLCFPQFCCEPKTPKKKKKKESLKTMKYVTITIT